METPLPRRLFPVCRHRHYLNHASVNGLAEPVAQRMVDWVGTALESGSFSGNPEAWVEDAREAAARLMGVDATEVAFIKNTSEGLSFVAAGLTWAPGDRVLVPEGEFPSNVYPWAALARRGVVVDTVAAREPGGALPLEAFVEAMADGPPPALIALSWVQFGRGWRSDLEAVCSLAHQVGALVCVDLIQGLGVLPADLGRWGVDFAACGAHKWLLGPPGIGLLYVRRSVMERLVPSEPGWASVAHREQWENRELVWDDTARRYESGTVNLVGVAGLSTAMGLLLDAGPQRIWEHVEGLCAHLCRSLEATGAQVLSDRGPGRSGIVTFELAPHHPESLVQALGERGVVVAPRGGGVRVSPHGCNTKEDIDALVEALEELGRRPALR